MDAIINKNNKYIKNHIHNKYSDLMHSYGQILFKIILLIIIFFI